MNKLTNILVSPLFLALIVTLIIIPFLPQTFDKYKTELIDSDKIYITNKSGNKKIVYYNDLDNDGKSEKILFFFHERFHFIIFNNNDGIINQMNFNDVSRTMNIKLSFGDYDSNGLNEIYFFLKKNDSVFIQGVEPLTEGGNATKYIKRTFIDTIWKRGADGRYDDGIHSVNLFDLNDDGYKEVIFWIGTGFSLQPRNYYAYDIANNTIYKSPKSGSNPRFPVYYDLNNDGKIEIISGTGATGNLPKNFPYSDNSAWLMVFDNKLNFLFKPVEFPHFTSEVKAVPYRINKETFIAVLYQYRGILKKKPALYIYTTKGIKVKEKKFPEENKKGSQNIITLSSKERDRLYLIDNKGNIAQLNEELDTINQYKIESLAYPMFRELDIDGDKEEELIFHSQDYQKLIITRNDFSHPITVDVPNNPGPVTATVKLNGDKKPNLSVQIGENWYLFTYLPNPLYYLKYLIYLGIYAGLFLFIYLVQKINGYKLEQDKKKLEKTVKERTEEILQQKDEIETQRDDILEKSKKLETANEEIELKNKEITDSITYAEHIQQAILPPVEEIKKTLPESFILFKPKDIVSGDFYFYAKVPPPDPLLKTGGGNPARGSSPPLGRGSVIILAACDCTGHGVPGAFMSMIGSQLLNEIVIDKSVDDAAEVLNQLRDGIIHAFGKAGATGEQKDGLPAETLVKDGKNKPNEPFILRNQSRIISMLLDPVPD
ncbi:MAG: hypothetical protein IIA88_06430 [Bacteroidetes bacterium]|nr:hypothetical protein [Bacteroidota bacterium]